jgi:hypothetical protein
MFCWFADVSYVGINTTDVTETPNTKGHEDQPPNNKLPLERKHSGQPHTDPKINQQIYKTKSNVIYAENEYK